MITNIPVQILAQAELAAPNWMLLIGIAAVFVFLVVFLLIPEKDVKAIEPDTKKALPGTKKAQAAEDVSLENYEEKKEALSLAEIKVAKRQTAEEMSKEELRELRKERRAATQTEKAVKEHEDAEPAKSEVESVSVSSEVNAVKAEEAVVSEPVESKSEGSVSESESLGGGGDVFSSLFGDSSVSESFSGFGDSFGSEAEEEGEAAIIPTLGSALIPLDQLLKAAEDEGKSEKDALEELSLQFPVNADSAEKKTLN